MCMGKSIHTHAILQFYIKYFQYDICSKSINIPELLKFFIKNLKILDHYKGKLCYILTYKHLPVPHFLLE